MLTADEIDRRLRESLRLLACSSEVQLALLPAFVCKADELALVFGEAFQLASEHNRIEQIWLGSNWIRSIDLLLDRMSRQGEQQLWTESAVHTDRHWKILRCMARRVLSANNLSPAIPELGWQT